MIAGWKQEQEQKARRNRPSEIRPSTPQEAADRDWQIEHDRSRLTRAKISDVIISPVRAVGNSVDVVRMVVDPEAQPKYSSDGVKHWHGEISDEEFSARVAWDQISTAVMIFPSRWLFTEGGSLVKLETSSGIVTPLRRPYIRQNVRAEVEARAPRNADGKFIDPNTGEPIKGTPDLGHKPGHEFWREKAKAEQERLTQAEFNERMNNPDYYQLEDPSSNRGHKFQQPK